MAFAGRALLIVNEDDAGDEDTTTCDVAPPVAQGICTHPKATAVLEGNVKALGAGFKLVMVTA